MKRNPLVAAILSAAMNMALMRDAFVQRVGFGGFSAGRHSRDPGKRQQAGSGLARKAEEKRIGMPRGTTFVGATITWPQSRRKAKQRRAMA